MAVASTFIHRRRVLKQIEDNFIGIQRDMRNNAVSWKAMAQSQSVPLATLRTFINDAAAAYLTRMQWVIDLRNDPVKKARLLEVLATQGVSEQEVIDLVTTFRQGALDIQNAPKGSYAGIVTLCDAILAQIDAPDSLWPE